MDNIRKAIIVAIIFIAVVVFFFAPIIGCGVLTYDASGESGPGPVGSTTLYFTPYEHLIEHQGYCPM